MSRSFTQVREDGVRHLRRRCPVMRQVIKAVGPCKLALQRDRFGMLARSILYQQISGHAARAIHGRLLDAMPEGALTPDGLAKLPDEDYRAAGVSGQKTRYMRSLGELTLSGQVRLQRIGRLSDEEIIAELTQVKGIGVWTAQMFLMFSLGRPDVLPWDDLGVRQGIQRMFGLEEAPGRDRCEELAEPWRPYATFASWYCWRVLEVENGGVFFK